MLNRRHIRIKVLQILYAYHQSESKDLKNGVKELLFSIEKMYDLYILLLLTLPEVKAISEAKNEERKNKLRPTSEDLNPNEKFLSNQLVKVLSENVPLQKIALNRKLNWSNAEHQEMFRKMFLEIEQSETYFDFMSNGKVGVEEDKLFAISLFKTEIANSKYLYNYFEDQSIYWLDDLDLCASMVLKTLKSWEDTKELAILPMFKPNDNEKEYMSTLFMKTIESDKELDALIDAFTENWELERIAKMDVLLLKMSITELIEFTEIPPKVTLNEYIEISKFYSTPKSNFFINGVLDKIIDQLKKEKRLNKTGRGLLN